MPETIAHALAEQYVSFNDKEDRLREELVRYKSVLDVTPCPMVLTDSEGKVVYVNESYCHMLKVDLATVADEGWINYVVEEDRERIVALWRDVIAGKLESFQGWVTFTLTGKVFWRARRLPDGSYAVAIFHPACAFFAMQGSCAIRDCMIKFPSEKP